MSDPEWPCSPPETNYLRLVGAGAAGTATTLASAAAWQALAASAEAAFSVSTMNTAATALNFDGVGGMSSSAAVTGLNAALQLLAGWVQEKPPVVAGAVSAYQAAVSAMIPAEVCLANRAEQAADVAMNPVVLGALTPAIVALDAEYFGEHWPHNASTGVAYGAALAALTAALAVPPPLSPPGASPAGPAGAAAALAQSAGRLAADNALPESVGAVENTASSADEATNVGAGIGQMAGQVAQLGPMFTGPLQSAAGMLQNPQALSAAMSLPQSLLGQLTGSGNPTARDDEGVWLPDDMVAGLTTPEAVGGRGGIPAPAGLALRSGALAGSGITSYSRPSAAFGPELGGRPVARTGLLGSAIDLSGPTATPTPGALPMPGKAAASDRKQANSDVAQTRIVVDDIRPQG